MSTTDFAPTLHLMTTDTAVKEHARARNRETVKLTPVPPPVLLSGQGREHTSAALTRFYISFRIITIALVITAIAMAMKVLNHHA